MVFKVKDNKPGNTGARCDQGAKLTAEKINDKPKIKLAQKGEVLKITSTKMQLYELFQQHFRTLLGAATFWTF